MERSVYDAKLVHRYLKGDEAALEELIKLYRHRVYSFIYSKVLRKDITEDIFQDTFMKVIKTMKRGNYNEEGKFLPWVMRIAHNLVIDHFRRNTRMPRFEDQGDYSVFSIIGDGSLNIENQMIQDQVEIDLRKLIDELPEDQKSVLEMRMYKDMSFKEIADLTGVSINTALGRMRYALINLRKMIETNNIVLTN